MLYANRRLLTFIPLILTPSSTSVSHDHIGVEREVVGDGLTPCLIPRLIVT